MEVPSIQEHSFPSQHYQLALEYPVTTTSLSNSLPEVIEVPELERPPEQPIEVISIYPPATAVGDKPFKTKNGHGTIFHHNANGDLSMSSIETSPKKINGDVSKESSPKRDSLSSSKTSKDNSPKRESRAKLLSKSIQKSFSTFGLYAKRKHESSKKDFKEFIPMQETHSKPILNNAKVIVCNGSIQKPPADGHRTPSRSSSPQPGPSGNGVRNPSKPKRGPGCRYELVNTCSSPEVERCEISVEPTDLEQTDAHDGRLIHNEKEQASLREAADRGTKFIAVIVILLFITLVVLLLTFA
ncbi:uncharacterized protein [Mytilus edulis]|uniref:Uncharacterized protein n=1 Tax=Mytilus edulis TaxID=6550 RepID=A0A8S3TSQ9_MYTED|nr:unnamed protein product [Mytilus edulis]